MMQQLRFHFIGLLFLIQANSGPLAGQSWDLVKDQYGIRIYERQEVDKSLKAFKATATIRAPAEKVFTLIEDVYHTDWWGPNFSQISVLTYEKNRRARYYMMYDAPWPVANRDLCVDVTVTIDPLKKIFKVNSVTLNGVIPQREDAVRIKDYKQSWTVSSSGVNLAQVVLEGYVDPAGSIPEWLSNRLIIESPFYAISEIRRRVENK